jgi:hypothetical protein
MPFSILPEIRYFHMLRRPVLQARSNESNHCQPVPGAAAPINPATAHRHAFISHQPCATFRLLPRNVPTTNSTMGTRLACCAMAPAADHRCRSGSLLRHHADGSSGFRLDFTWSDLIFLNMARRVTAWSSDRQMPQYGVVELEGVFQLGQRGVVGFDVHQNIRLASSDRVASCLRPQSEAMDCAAVAGDQVL